MSGRAPTTLQEPAHDRKPRPVRAVQTRLELRDLLTIKPLGIDPVTPHGIASTHHLITLCIGVRQIEDPARTEHHIEIQIGRQALPEFQRVLVQSGVGVQHVIGANDRRISPRIATAQPAFFKYRHIAYAVQTGQVVRCGQTVPTPSDNHHIVMPPGLRASPGLRPATMTRQCVDHQRGD